METTFDTILMKNLSLITRFNCYVDNSNHTTDSNYILNGEFIPFINIDLFKFNNPNKLITKENRNIEFEELHKQLEIIKNKIIFSASRIDSYNHYKVDQFIANSTYNKITICPTINKNGTSYFNYSSVIFTLVYERVNTHIYNDYEYQIVPCVKKDELNYLLANIFTVSNYFDRFVYFVVRKSLREENNILYEAYFTKLKERFKNPNIIFTENIENFLFSDKSIIFNDFEEKEIKENKIKEKIKEYAKREINNN